MDGVKELVEKLIVENPIMIFSKTHCPYCRKAKGVIKGLNKNYKVVELDVESNGAAIQSYLATKTRQRTVPNIFIGGEHVGGCDDLLDAQSNGSLAKMVSVL